MFYLDTNATRRSTTNESPTTDQVPTPSNQKSERTTTAAVVKAVTRSHHYRHLNRPAAGRDHPVAAGEYPETAGIHWNAGRRITQAPLHSIIMTDTPQKLIDTANIRAEMVKKEVVNTWCIDIMTGTLNGRRRRKNRDGESGQAAVGRRKSGTVRRGKRRRVVRVVMRRVALVVVDSGNGRKDAAVVGVKMIAVVIKR